MPSLLDLEPKAWSEANFSDCQLGDIRRTRRLVAYAQQMAENPDASTPQQTENWADCKAAYRLFECSEVDFESVTAAHYKQTCSMESGTYLVISDTTEIDYGYKSTRRGLGRLGSVNRRGFFLHSALIVKPHSGTVVGLGAQELFTRSLKKLDRVHFVEGCRRATEAEVWGRVIDRVAPTNHAVKLIHVCDRGADNFDVFAHLQVKGDSWVIRVAQLRRKVRTASGEIDKLDNLLQSVPSQGAYQIYVNANNKQKPRWANVEVKATSITLLRPHESTTRFVKDQDIHKVETNVVEVHEVDPPKGCKAIRWVLYTREPVSSFKASMEVITHYEKRPIIEEFHKGTKTGLCVENRQYESADRLSPVIGLISIQAVRLLQLRDVATNAPETAAKRLVPPQWLEVLSKVLRRRSPLTTIRDFMRALASLGGFLGRKHDGEPGWIVIWRGIKTLTLALRGYRAAIKKCG